MRLSDRDWIIYIECRADCVVIYPAQMVFPLASLTTPLETNPLLVTLRKMIERRQSLVPAGEPPYRVQIRYLIRPGSLRTFHATYPVLDGLPVPKTRQNLNEEDDVRSVMK